MDEDVDDVLLLAVVVQVSLDEDDFLEARLVAARVTPANRPAAPLLFPVVDDAAELEGEVEDGAQQYGLSAALPISELSSRLSWMGSSVKMKRH